VSSLIGGGGVWWGVAADRDFSTWCCDDVALLRPGLLKYTANPAISDTTAIAIINALKLSLFILLISTFFSFNNYY